MTTQKKVIIPIDIKTKYFDHISSMKYILRIKEKNTHTQRHLKLLSIVLLVMIVLLLYEKNVCHGIKCFNIKVVKT